MTQPTMGVMARSLKENERRHPLHPHHLERIPRPIRDSIFFEHGYGDDFGLSDDHLKDQVGGMRTRGELIAECDVIMQPKPMLEDITALRVGQTFWGWPHCVQDRKLTQVAIDRRLTVIAFEAMNHWHRDGSYNLHVFHKNNEMAGYCSVLHAMQIAGITGAYGPRLSAVVIGFGATARGAVCALNSLGVYDVDVLTHRAVAAVGAPIHSAQMVHFDDEIPGHVSRAVTEEGSVPLTRFLADHDIIVNCVLQDPNAPLMFMTDDDLAHTKPGTLVVDVSCDDGMGFSWARPTTFDEPTFVVGSNLLYYGVDHSPSYLWNAATWEISEALIPFLGTVLQGGDAWESVPTIHRAVEIRDGVIQNPAILAFQRRSPQYPHAPLTT